MRRRHGLRRIALPDGLVEWFWAITVERRLRHTSVVASAAAARRDLLA